MIYTKEDARELGRQFANMSDELQAIALAAMAAQGREWQEEWDEANGDTDKDLAAHQWQSIGDRIKKLPNHEADGVRRIIYNILATMGEPSWVRKS